MNKLVKGAIAGAAGIALLLGGAGTFALWNSKATVTGGTIVAGNLVVVPDSAAGYWTVNTSTTQLSSISGYLIVPGDVLTYHQTVDVTATGDDLAATLSLGTASIAPTSSANTADVQLAAYLRANTVLAATGASISGSGPLYTVSTGVSAQPVVVTATITFPSTAGNATKTGSVSLADMTVLLAQN